MPQTTYMPRLEIEQVAWSQNLVDVVTPNAAAYGVPTAVMTAFAAVNDSLQTAWAAASAMNSRTRGSVADKNTALRQMKIAARQVVGLIQSTPTVSDQMKIDAKVTVRKTHPTPSPVPGYAPVPVIKAVNDRTVSLELWQDKQKRGRPAKVAGASVFTAPAGAALSDTTAWTLYANTTQTKLDVVFPPSTTGDSVQITAYWSNSRGESGPAAKPVTVNLPASGNLPSARTVRLAA
ncbi:MAG: hypothetical protein QM754_06855 [Tepidisphaeraceae bacterium]